MQVVFPSQSPQIVIYDSVETFLLWPNPTHVDIVTCCVNKAPSASFLSFSCTLKSVMLGMAACLCILQWIPTLAE